MAEKVVRFCDFEKRSREPDAAQPRDPCDSAVIIILPVIRVENYDSRRLLPPSPFASL